MVKAGQTFETGNEVINAARPGTVFEYLGDGQVEVIDVPKPELGDVVVDEKGRVGTKVRPSVHLDLILGPDEDLMVDEDYVVRVFKF